MPKCLVAQLFTTDYGYEALLIKTLNFQIKTKMSKETQNADKAENDNDFIDESISRSYTPKEVRELFIKLETERSKYYAEDANDIVPLDEWLSENGL